ncbi:hypothetical protein C8R45DRAFT_766745, partial [Mycena sanguinolenta]
ILFLMEFGLWVELNYAVAEGDVGQVFKIFKIFVFTFAGTSNQNYMLDLYVLLEFECSPELKEALQSQRPVWQVPRGRPNAGMEQSFDEKFYCRTVAPNVLRFLKMKEDVETAFYLKWHGKAHTSPHLRDEMMILLRLYKDEELHQFRSGQSMGYVAVNRFDRAYQRLDGGKMTEYLERS